MRHVRRVVLVIVGVVFWALAGCGSSPAPISGVFVGPVNDSDAFIAIVSNGANVTAYACDGATIAEWFKGPVSDNAVDLTSDDGLKLSARLTADAATGSFVLADGTALSFSAAPASGDAGLYRADETFDGVKYVGGWIILADGQ